MAPRTVSPAEQARLKADITMEAMAQRARLSPGYLRRLERYGCQSWELARLLAHLYQCRVDYFLPNRPKLSHRKRKPGRVAAARLSSPASYPKPVDARSAPTLDLVQVAEFDQRGNQAFQPRDFIDGDAMLTCVHFPGTTQYLHAHFCSYFQSTARYGRIASQDQIELDQRHRPPYEEVNAFLEIALERPRRRRTRVALRSLLPVLQTR